MRSVGIPKEIKDSEQRVSEPDGAAELVHHGHEVLVFIHCICKYAV